MHEQKNCPRCGQGFECRVGSISICHCSEIKLSGDLQAFIRARYEDCLCSNCLREISNEQVFFREKYWQQKK